MTINAIAKKAGVSPSTVSRVMNNHSSVRPELAARVKDAMKELNYTPRLRRRGPKVIQSVPQKAITAPIVHVLFGRGRDLLSFPFTARLVAGMTEAAQELGICFMVVEMPDMTALPALLQEKDIAGCTAAGHPPAADTAEIFHPLPVVWAGTGGVSCPQLDQVANDTRQEAILAANYLIERGCHRPAFVNHVPRRGTSSRQYTTFQSECADRGLEALSFETDGPALPETEAWEPNYLRAALGALLDKLLAQPTRPDGIFLPTDQQAAIAHTLLRERGVQPEKDVILVSCNNDEPWRATMNPRSATIDNRPDQIGREAVRRLVARIQHPNEAPVHVAVQPCLVAGGTAGSQVSD